ncbi:MAG: glutamate 5-kinase [Pseudotabrizicola sp.]|uniref:glutamate 5-kinase n=1 Tax=Pseudotabrizicola sp. TaxID=2939647 RepID=UPI00272260AD|nr:glutamate 5-kinase [Pseudotabrizicola sp.]MDO8884937.1 glutamate 5-kinase [Pseudotabrizicola sp.]MDP2081374.1 glutamate 5-kinase [Pseudotabrizicola sp.]MDZ7575259.1 glutamate 5-kinase [Pseudotabrizicola sp.]
MAALSALHAPDIRNAKRLVVKIGSALLVDRQSGLKQGWLSALAMDVAEAKVRGTDVVLVSSGSIALGRKVLGLGDGVLTLEQSQAAAAVGQIRLARAYEEVLAPHGITTAQVLVTLEDTTDRRRYLNSRATMETLLGLGVVPIVNENDTVATDEIRFGDNDRLAAQIAVTVGADQLILLSDVDGFYSANPKSDPTAQRFDLVEHITSEIEAMAGDPISGMSKGGMKTKLLAAKTAIAGGCAMAIMEGSVLRPLSALANGAQRTWFVAQADPQLARKRWINAMKPRGELVLDAGAVTALRAGKSLLPAGVTRVTGSFGRGEPVSILSPEGLVLGKGLVRYTAAEAKAIAGHRSGDIAGILGYEGRAALVHRDDMVI